MKNLFASILIALTVSTSSASFAASQKTLNQEQTGQVTTPSVSFAQVVKSKLDVIVKNAANAKMSIHFFDSSGKNIATKTLSKKKTDTRVRFDLAALKDGVYQVKVSDGRNTQVQKFELKTNVPVISAYKDVAIL